MNILNTLFNGKKENKPTFMNEFVSAEENRQIRTLNELIDRVPNHQKKNLENEIKFIKIGLSGERKIKHELENSYMNIICLHDIRLEYKGLSAQIDFIVIAEKFICVIESKKLVGDIDINTDGDFTRVYKDFNGKIIRREGMYSPVSQNDKHVKFLRNMLIDNKLINNFPVHSLVVSANEKTIINKHYAPNYIKNIITKHEHISNILEKYDRSSEFEFSNKKMVKIADFILDNVIEKDFDYIKKFGLNIIKEDVNEVVVETEDVQVEITEITEITENTEIKDVEIASTDNSNDTDELQEVNELQNDLKKYRRIKAKELKCELYMIFNNVQLESILNVKPTNKEEFISIKGFAEKKYEHFGDDIINIVISSIKSTEDSGNDEVVSDDILITKLKEYRKYKAKELNLELGFVFSNKQLDELMVIRPKTKEEFLKVVGFGEKKYEQFGDGLISIFK